MSVEGWSVTIENSGIKEERGPLSDSELLKLFQEGLIKRTTGIFHPSKTKGKWVRADQLPALRQRFEKSEEEAEERAAREQRSKLGGMVKTPPPIQSEVMPPPMQPAPQYYAHPPMHQPVVVMTGPEPRAPMGAGGWFTRSFAVVSGYIIAIAFFTLVPLAVIFFLCCGGLAIFSTGVNEAIKKDLERQKREREQQQAAPLVEPESAPPTP